MFVGMRMGVNERAECGGEAMLGGGGGSLLPLKNVVSGDNVTNKPWMLLNIRASKCAERQNVQRPMGSRVATLCTTACLLTN